MKTAKDRKIEKLEEINKLTEDMLMNTQVDECSTDDWDIFISDANKLKSELAAIDKEIDQSEKHECQYENDGGQCIICGNTFADKIKAEQSDKREVIDEDAGKANSDLLLKRVMREEIIEPVSYSLGFKDCYKWARDYINYINNK